MIWYKAGYDLKICLVLISDGWGGAENVVYSLAKKLKEKVSLITILNNEIVKYFSSLENVKIFKMSSLFDFKSLTTSILLGGARNGGKFRWNSGPFYFLNGILRQLYSRRVCKDILRILTQQKVDIVHLHLGNSLIFFLPLFKELDVPIVFTLHGVGILNKPRLVEMIRARAIMKGLKRVDKITCVSRYAGKMLENSGISIPDEHVIIHNGVDIAEIRKNRRAALEGEFRLLFPGGAKIQKGGDLLIKALPSIKKEIPNVHLYIAGAVPRKNILRRLVEEMELEQDVTFMGFLPPQQYHQVLSSVDLFVLPSEIEAFPIACLEAMALGKPVVATKTGGIPEAIRNMRNGILVDRDPQSIADAIVYLFKNKDLYEEISANNLENVRSFDWSNIVNEYIELYEQLTERGTSYSMGTIDIDRSDISSERLQNERGLPIFGSI